MGNGIGKVCQLNNCFPGDHHHQCPISTLCVCLCFSCPLVVLLLYVCFISPGDIWGSVPHNCLHAASFKALSVSPTACLILRVFFFFFFVTEKKLLATAKFGFNDSDLVLWKLITIAFLKKCLSSLWREREKRKNTTWCFLSARNCPKHCVYSFHPYTTFVSRGLFKPILYKIKFYVK